MCGFGCFFDVVLSGVWTAMFCACQLIIANAILALSPPFYTAHARLRGKVDELLLGRTTTDECGNNSACIIAGIKKVLSGRGMGSFVYLNTVCTTPSFLADHFRSWAV